MSKADIRNVSIVIEITGPTDRDPWEWGQQIARGLKAEFVEGGEDFGPIKVECVDVNYGVRNE